MLSKKVEIALMIFQVSLGVAPMNPAIKDMDIMINGIHPPNTIITINRNTIK